MDRFLIRNNKKPNYGTQNSEPAPKKKKYDESSVKVRRYLSEYLGLGFSATKSDPVNAQCVLCGQVLANSSMKPAHMNRHLSTVHPSHVGKPIEFFKLAKQKKPHTIAECLILPALVKVSEIMFDTKTATALQSIPVSNNTISRRIEDIASDIVMQSRTTGEELFKVIDKFFAEGGVLCDWCLSVCSNGAAALTGKNNGLMAWIRKKNPEVKWLHCNIHWQALGSKRMNAHLHETLNEAVKVINFIKARPLNSRMFKLLCQEMGSEHQHLLLHTEDRWLSRGKILNRLFELRQEVHMFLLEQKSAFSSLFENQDWVCRLAYLADIFDKMNDMNLSMQG
ncbi:hypothetical protein QYM36_011381 [Artemia franciscana]|uniref:Uncharacterized protein n=1 Tax=Artemia franciscana TaxID=6661 RepID=A0AA88HIJ6_ARTSF|nr:hypothetical protein QYM36_011381 [Artemia franciscana]